jgi:hypothetical protein
MRRASLPLVTLAALVGTVWADANIVGDGTTADSITPSLVSGF